MTGEDDESAQLELLKLEQALVPPVGILDIQAASHGQSTRQQGSVLIAKEDEDEAMHLPSAPSHLAEPRRGGQSAMQAEPLLAVEEPLPAS